MDLFEQPRGRASPKRGIQLQGPRPSPLKVNKDSHKLKKPSFPPPAGAPAAQRRPPVIIYTVSPKIIHTKPSEFMSLVQRLTGCSASDAPAATRTNGDATDNNVLVEQTSPAQNKTAKDQDDTDDLRRLVIGSGSTAAIQPISPNFFSPSVVDINQFNFFHELNVPALHGNKGMMDGGFMPSPGNFFFSL